VLQNFGGALQNFGSVEQNFGGVEKKMRAAEKKLRGVEHITKIMLIVLCTAKHANTSLIMCATYVCFCAENRTGYFHRRCGFQGKPLLKKKIIR